MTSEFDRDLDECLAVVGEYYSSDTCKFVVTVRRYNNGPCKVHLERWYRTQKHPEWKVKRPGRLSFKESEAIGKLLLQAAFANEDPMPPKPIDDVIPW